MVCGDYYLLVGHSLLFIWGSVLDVTHPSCPSQGGEKSDWQVSDPLRRLSTALIAALTGEWHWIQPPCPVFLAQKPLPAGSLVSIWNTFSQTHSSWFPKDDEPLPFIGYKFMSYFVVRQGYCPKFTGTSFLTGVVECWNSPDEHLYQTPRNHFCISELILNKYNFLSAVFFLWSLFASTRTFWRKGLQRKPCSTKKVFKTKGLTFVKQFFLFFYFSFILQCVWESTKPVGRAHWRIWPKKECRYSHSYLLHSSCPINLLLYQACFLGSGRNPENPERTHAHMGENM